MLLAYCCTLSIYPELHIWMLIKRQLGHFQIRLPLLFGLLQKCCWRGWWAWPYLCRRLTLLSDRGSDQRVARIFWVSSLFDPLCTWIEICMFCRSCNDCYKVNVVFCKVFFILFLLERLLYWTGKYWSSCFCFKDLYEALILSRIVIRETPKDMASVFIRYIFWDILGVCCVFLSMEFHKSHINQGLFVMNILNYMTMKYLPCSILLLRLVKSWFQTEGLHIKQIIISTLVVDIVVVNLWVVTNHTTCRTRLLLQTLP